MYRSIHSRSRVLFTVAACAAAFAACAGEPGGDTGAASQSAAASARAARDEKASECAPDATPEKVCKPVDDKGEVECVIECVGQAPEFPVCEQGTSPVKACKAAEGQDEECFLLCLPDGNDEPGECGPGERLEKVCRSGDDEQAAFGEKGDEGAGEVCELACVPDQPEVPECKDGTRPEKVCRLVDKDQGIEECFLECVPVEGEPDAACKEGTRPVLVCRPVGDEGKEECSVVCEAFDPEKPPTDKP